MSRVIEAFGRWFASAGAVIWIAAVTTAAVVVEHVWPALDPNGFQFLYWLTWGSWVTQPVLAYVGILGAAKTDEALLRLETVLAHLEAAERRELELLEHLAAMRDGAS